MLTLLALCGGVVLATGIGAVACCVLGARAEQARLRSADGIAAEQRAQDAARATAAAWEAAIRDGHQEDWA